MESWERNVVPSWSGAGLELLSGPGPSVSGFSFRDVFNVSSR